LLRRQGYSEKRDTFQERITKGMKRKKVYSPCASPRPTKKKKERAMYEVQRRLRPHNRGRMNLARTTEGKCDHLQVSGFRFRGKVKEKHREVFKGGVGENGVKYQKSRRVASLEEKVNET